MPLNFMQVRFGGKMRNTLELDVLDLQPTEFPAPSIGKATCFSPDSKILRFAKSERVLHWTIAGPFLVSFATGLILVLFYNPDPSRSLRGLIATLHRASGIALTVFPLLALLGARRDARLHLYNIKQAWTWIYDDFKWLALMGLAAISSRFVLPEQGKFNAAEKLNFMVLMSTYPLYIVTGILMWVMPLAVLSWIMHSLMALMATPLLLGHLYMALINASTRAGLEGMVSGHVDRQWAKHHYRRWYRKHYEAEEEQPSSATLAAAAQVDGNSFPLEMSALAANGSFMVISSMPNPIVLWQDRTREYMRFHGMHVYRGSILPGQPKMINDRLLYELEPDRFLRLINGFRGNPGAPAMFDGSNPANLSHRFDSLSLSDHSMLRNNHAADRIFHVADTTGGIVLVSAGMSLFYTAGIGPRSCSACDSNASHFRGNSIPTFPRSVTPASHMAREG
jgi:formate dehydrogenase subunit gamma